MFRIRPFLAAAVAIAAMACSDSTIEISRPVTASVRLTPGDKSLNVGERVNYTAIALTEDGAELPGRVVTWASSNSNIASITESGVLTANAAGQAKISAEVDGRSATATITVIATEQPQDSTKVVRVALTPAAAVVEIGETKRYTAVGLNAAGRIVPGKTATWVADNPNAATIDATGALLGVGAGYLAVTATIDGTSASVSATVVADESLAYDLLYHRDATNGDGEIFILNPATGAEPFRLNAGTVSRMPTASPDGNRIAFQVSMLELGTNKRIDDIFAVDRNGMNMKRLTISEGVDDAADWSPNGDRIAYRHTEEISAVTGVWVMYVDGGSTWSLTGSMGTEYTIGSPKWSPDGQRIAFWASHNRSGGTATGIWVMNADGTDRRAITSTLTGFDQLPSWSPDGKKIAFVRAYDGDWDIAIADVATGAVTRVAMAGNQSFPAWSPDGELIAFTQPYPGASRSGVYTMRPDGSAVRLRTTKKDWGGGTAPAWITRR